MDVSSQNKDRLVLKLQFYLLYEEDVKEEKLSEW